MFCDWEAGSTETSPACLSAVWDPVSLFKPSVISSSFIAGLAEVCSLGGIGASGSTNLTGTPIAAEVSLPIHAPIKVLHLYSPL